jgi:hypothetical protein
MARLSARGASATENKKPGLRLGKGAIELPPGTAPRRPPPFSLEMHSPTRPAKGYPTFRGAIPVEFTATHRGHLPPPDYQIVVWAENVDTREIATTHAFDPYVLPHGETRTDKFATALPVPPGVYAVWVELRCLRPTVDETGAKLGDYLGAYRQHSFVKVEP